MLLLKRLLSGQPARGHSANLEILARPIHKACERHEALEVRTARLLGSPGRRRRRKQSRRSRRCSRRLEALSKRSNVVFGAHLCHDKTGRSSANHSRRTLHQVKASRLEIRPPKQCEANGKLARLGSCWRAKLQSFSTACTPSELDCFECGAVQKSLRDAVTSTRSARCSVKTLGAWGPR